MQKLRPYVLPGLLMFHLVVLFVTLSTVSRENETSQQVTAVIIVSQFFLTALFAGMGSGAWTLRIPSWGALAALGWLSFAFFAVHSEGGPPRNAGLWRVPLLFLIGWIVTVTLLLLLRVIPVLQWRVVSRSTLPCSQPRRDSVTRGILVVVATWGGVLMLLKDSYPWSPAATAISKSSDDLLSHVGIAAFVGVGALVVGLLAMSLGLTRFADWMFYRRRWTLPVLVNLVTCAAIILLLSFGGPFKTGPERLLAALWLLPALATQPLTTLLIMGMAGYRLTARKQSEHHVSGLPSQATATITEKPVENWFLNLQRPHIAALVVALLFFVGYVPTGALNRMHITTHSRMIGRNDAGEITQLISSDWATRN